MISYDELQKTIFDYAYGAALGDAIGQKAFEGNKIPLRNNEDAKAIARQYIDDILNGLSPDFYETVGKLENSFKKYIDANKDAVVLRIKNKNGTEQQFAERQRDKNGNLIEPIFRFGNAQKLLNMLAKNMFLLVYQDELLRANFTQCHCPMDNIMINNIKKALKEMNDEEASLLLKRYKDSEKLAWSRIETANLEQYEAFQACIKFLADKQGLSPIEYDYWQWKKTQQIDPD